MSCLKESSSANALRELRAKHTYAQCTTKIMEISSSYSAHEAEACSTNVYDVAVIVVVIIVDHAS